MQLDGSEIELRYEIVILIIDGEEKEIGKVTTKHKRNKI